MMKKLLVTALAFSWLFPGAYSYGFEKMGQDCSRCHTLSHQEARDLLNGIWPDLKILDIRLSPSKGFWELFLESGGKKGLIYVDFSKKYLMMGSIISIKERKNLTQERFSDLDKVDVSQIPLDDALVMGNPKAKSRVIVFHDPD